MTSSNGTFSALLAHCAGNSPVPVNSPHKGQWREALMFSFIYAWINDWVNNREAGDLKRQRGHYDVIVMGNDRLSGWMMACFSTLRQWQNGCHYADDRFKFNFLNENIWISIKISLKFVPRWINDSQALVTLMAWRRSGDKPLSEPMMVRLPTHICVTRLQCINDANMGHPISRS